MAEPGERYPAGDIERFLAAAFVALDVPERDAETVARLMVRADLYGYETHGTFRLRQYANRLRAGGTNPKANVTVAADTGATAVVDGDNGLGHLSMVRATELAIDKAEAYGIGWVGVRNGNHAGPASLYVNMAVERNLIGLYGAVGSANHMPPFGGSERLLGTNPIAIAVPAGKSPPFVLDMATTVAAAGKIRTLAQRGEPMPEGWMVGRDGKPLTDPKRQGEGFMLPIGGPKGYGLAMALGLLAGTLNGAAFGRDVVDMTKQPGTPTNTGQFIAAISVAAFGDVDAFKANADSVFQTIRESEALPGHGAVRIPGEHRGEMFEDRSANGVPLHPKLIAALSEIADELDIPKLV
jgi:LDH2 family malate/lactate/ureidoglycolate dehydrogenase